MNPLSYAVFYGIPTVVAAAAFAAAFLSIRAIRGKRLIVTLLTSGVLLAAVADYLFLIRVYGKLPPMQPPQLMAALSPWDYLGLLLLLGAIIGSLFAVQKSRACLLIGSTGMLLLFLFTLSDIA